MAQWFGEPWGAPVNDGVNHVATPVGQKCTDCEEIFIDGDQGHILPSADGLLPYHHNCFLVHVIGSLSHQLRSCSCFGGNGWEPEQLSRRQKADQAVELYYREHGG